MLRTLAVTLALATTCKAWAPIATTKFARHTHMHMAIDYNDPAVAEQFNAVQPLSYEEVEEELMKSGVSGSADMNEMDLKLMLVELRMRLSGNMPGEDNTKKEKPASFSSKFEEMLFTKPQFEELYNELKGKGDINSMNVVKEYLTDEENAKTRYAKDYKALLRKVEAALNAKVEVTSPSVSFSGFPANMGEMGCKMTLEALGEIVDFECVASDDFPILTGTVTFEDIETAKKAIDQYDGMDMGMGQALEMNSV